jgi:tyrosyl-tRNA synthetase
MSAYKSDFLNILNERGFIHQCSDFEGLDSLASKGEAVGYIGYDCTARSLHIGNYLTMMMLYWLQQSGNKPIALMGGGTTMVGDPSGKDETRADAHGRGNRRQQGIDQGVFSRVLNFGDGATDAIMVDNADWLLKLELHRHAARCRPAFLGQPHAVDGFGPAAPRARAGDELHRVQLHGLPVL